MLRINNYGIKIIKQFEGFRPMPYLCPGGKKTIGYGHVILPHESFEEITQEEADNILAEDLIKVEQGVMRYICANLNDNQFSALSSFTINVGIGALQRSVLRQKINYGSSIEEICAEFSRWVYSNGIKLKGLILRRDLESILYAT